jgi:hypothetical protein
MKNICLALVSMVLIASCSGLKNNGIDEEAIDHDRGKGASPAARARRDGSILNAFRNKSKADIRVNRFLWTATLDVLSFLPVETADPFTGVISTGYGRPPGGGTAYRATVLISDPALDARSLNVALQSQRGPVSASTQRAVEDAILARARQLRIGAGKF